MLKWLLNKLFGFLAIFYMGKLSSSKKEAENEAELLKDFNEIDSRTMDLSRRAVLNELHKR